MIGGDMRVVDSETMRSLDERTIASGISGKMLMEKAGAGVAKIALELLHSIEGKRIAIITGPGNNGGDGWVSARLLAEQGVPVEVFSVVAIDKLNGDAKNAFNLARDANIFYKICPDGDFDLDGFDLVIDALLGTGARGAPTGSIANAVRTVMNSEIPVLAVDMPTGVDADTGQVLGDAVRAIATATLGLPKLGQFIYPGREFVGRLFTVDIGIPKDLVDALEDEFEIDSTEKLSSMLPFRRGNENKGDFGKALILAGSCGMSGAAVMTAESCLRSGTGLVELAVPKSLVDTVESLFRESVTKPLPEVKSRRCFSVRALGDIIGLAKDCDAIAIGPGIGTYRETVDLIGRLLPKMKIPMVIDADGLNCISLLKSRGIEIEFGSSVVITPHPGELARLLGKSIDEIVARRYLDMRDWAKELSVDVLVLKGSPTTISCASGNIYINRTGNHGMATGGSGDVLTGLIAGFLAQGVTPLESARLGVYIHGLAGDIASAELGARGMIAGDICYYIPDAIKALEDFPLFDMEE